MPRTPGRVTLKQIASRVGLTCGAVSLALRNQPGVSSTTRDRVQRAARAMGFRTDALVAAHTSYVRSVRRPKYRSTLALLGSWGRDSLIEQYRCGMEARALRLGYRVDFVELGADGMTTARANTILRNRGVQGVVIAPLRNPGGLDGFSWEEFASVALGYTLLRDDVHRAARDIFAAVGAVIAQATARGYRRLGLILDVSDDDRARHLALARFLSWQHFENQRSPVPPLLTHGLTRTSLAAWLEEHEPDFVISPRPAILDWLRKAGLKVPGEVGFAVPCCTPDSGSCSGVAANYEGVGAAAVDLLVEQLQRGRPGLPSDPRLTLVRGKWHEGATMRPDANGALPSGVREGDRRIR